MHVARHSIVSVELPGKPPAPAEVIEPHVVNIFTVNDITTTENCIRVRYEEDGTAVLISRKYVQRAPLTY